MNRSQARGGNAKKNYPQVGSQLLNRHKIWVNQLFLMYRYHGLAVAMPVSLHPYEAPYFER